MRVVRGAYFWQFGSIASLPTETTDGLVAFLAQTWPQKRSQSAKFLKIFKGGMPPDPPTLFTLTHTQWPYQSEIAGAGPVFLAKTCKNATWHWPHLGLHGTRFLHWFGTAA